MEELPPDKRLKVGLIFSYGANEAEADGILDDEAFDTDALDRDTRSFLEDAIQDYNDMFGTSYDTSADRFQNYYKDLSQRMKNREIDLVIVVNMFLTGFDATTLNTLFVDKNLRAHGLIQAYSRTNRILNSVKTYGNIVAFRDLEEETNAALELFGNKDARGVVLLKPYVDYYGEYVDKVTELLTHFPIGQQIVGEQAQKDFIQLFGAILRLQNILTSFDDFDGNDPLTERQRQDYTSIYLRLRDEFTRDRDGDREVINEDVVFEIELVKQVEINVDYILMLVEKLRAEKGDGDDKEVRAEITRAVDASPTLRSKRDLVEDFVESVSLQGAVDEQWQAYIAAKREAELQELIEAHKLKLEQTRSFVDAAFRDGQLRTAGTEITRILQPVSRFNRESNHGDKKKRVIEALSRFFERFRGLATGVGSLGTEVSTKGAGGTAAHAPQSAHSARHARVRHVRASRPGRSTAHRFGHGRLGPRGQVVDELLAQRDPGRTVLLLPALGQACLVDRDPLGESTSGADLDVRAGLTGPVGSQPHLHRSVPRDVGRLHRRVAEVGRARVERAADHQCPPSSNAGRSRSVAPFGETTTSLGVSDVPIYIAGRPASPSARHLDKCRSRLDLIAVRRFGILTHSDTKARVVAIGMIYPIAHAISAYAVVPGQARFPCSRS
nr:hypothetical protein [Tessaracoccus coleopterorum]